MKGWPLTARETEVAELMARGMSNADMAKALGVAPRTMDVHRTRVVDKMGARDTVQAVAMMNQRALAEAHARIADLERELRVLNKLVGSSAR